MPFGFPGGFPGQTPPYLPGGQGTPGVNIQDMIRQARMQSLFGGLTGLGGNLIAAGQAGLTPAQRGAFISRGGEGFQQGLGGNDPIKTMLLMAQLQKLNAPPSATAPIQNFEYRNQLVTKHGEGSPEVNRYDNYVRQNPWINLGGSMALPNPSLPGTMAAQVPKTVPPEQTPEVKGAQAAATTAAKEKTERAIETPAQKAVDTAYAKDYADFTAGGGFADAQKNVAELRGAVAELRKGGVTGPIIGNTPKQILQLTNPRAVDVRERIEQTVQRSLRPILGAQFTEKEGERLISRAFNPALDDKTNADRVERLLGALENALTAKQAAAAYFEANGTLKGFKGSALVGIADIEKAIEGKGAKPPAGGWSIQRVD